MRRSQSDFTSLNKEVENLCKSERISLLTELSQDYDFLPPLPKLIEIYVEKTTKKQTDDKDKKLDKEIKINHLCCRALKIDGKQCTRQISTRNNFCHTHQKKYDIAIKSNKPFPRIEDMVSKDQSGSEISKDENSYESESYLIESRRLVNDE